jgi:AcrR family transcriptional regulator
MILPRRSIDHRGDATRQRILDAAIGMFAQCGFEGASTRQLAAEAGVNQPAIQYHFSSKDGLYRAAIDCIADDLRGQMAEVNIKVTAVLDDPAASARRLEAALFESLDRFASIILEENGKESWTMFILRAEIEDQEALTALSNAIVANVVRPVSLLVQRLLPGEDEKLALLRSLSLIGMVTAFKNRCIHAAIRRALGWEKFGAQEIEQVKALIRQQAHAILSDARGASV